MWRLARAAYSALTWLLASSSRRSIWVRIRWSSASMPFPVRSPTHLANDVVVARLLEIGHDHLLGIGLGIVARDPHLLRRPKAEKLVAPGDDLELKLLIVLELRLGGFLAVVKRVHAPGSQPMIGRARIVPEGPSPVHGGQDPSDGWAACAPW